MQIRFQRAYQDTEGFNAWKRELLVAIIAGGLCWWWLPKQEAVPQIIAITIAVAAAVLIVPLIEFFWNFYHAPIRILKEENQSLREEIAQYKSSSAKEVINIEGNEHEVTRYGNKFVLDEPIQLLRHISDQEDFSVMITAPCPAHSLVELRYNMVYNHEGGAAYGMVGNSRLALARPGRIVEPMLTGSGREIIAIGDTCNIQATVHNPVTLDMVLEIDLISWEQHGDW